MGVSTQRGSKGGYRVGPLSVIGPLYTHWLVAIQDIQIALNRAH